MNPRKACENCRDGVLCRTCGNVLRPAPEALSARDYKLMLTLIDGSDRKYAPKTLEAVRTVFGVTEATAKSALHKLRLKLRRLLSEAERAGTQAPAAAQEAGPLSSREEVMRQFRAGVLSPEDAERLLAQPGVEVPRGGVRL